MDAAWEIVSVSDMSEFSFVPRAEDDNDDVVSVCTATGFPALCDVVDDDAATAMRALSFKDALLLGAGGLATDQAAKLSRAKTVLAAVQRKPRKPRDRAEIDSAMDDGYQGEDEYWTRKARGCKLYHLRNPRARLKFCAPIVECDESDDDDYLGSE